MYSSLPCSRLLLAVTGSLHAIQLVDYLLRLRREFATTIRVMMTSTAAEMISPKVVELVTESPVIMGLWGDHSTPSPHIRLTAWAELFVVLPASANILAKAANGIADDLVSTALVATPAPVVFAPAMNPVMWNSAAVQRNVATLRADGHYVIEPKEGVSLTTGKLDTGLGQTPDNVMPHLWHVHMRRLRQEIWQEATAQVAASPSVSKQLPLVPISQVGVGPPGQRASGSPGAAAASDNGDQSNEA
jgi:phosphopantothenoylcysteine decarboxylase/phosphopantothenate--cysteine ligase